MGLWKNKFQRVRDELQKFINRHKRDVINIDMRIKKLKTLKFNRISTTFNHEQKNRVYSDYSIAGMKSRLSLDDFFKKILYLMIRLFIAKN